MRVLVALLLSLPAFSGCNSTLVEDRDPREWAKPKVGACVSEHPLATQIGLDVLAQGGSAADAAVAMALALAVVYPQAGNLGGGGFALVVPQEGESVAIDFREAAPAAAREALYLDGDGRRVEARSLEGPLAVGVPGTPAGLWELHKQGGVLRFDALVEPAIRLARDGFPIDAWLALELAEEHNHAKFNAAARELFWPGGKALGEGAILRQPVLAETLSLYANLGPRAFYEGRLARGLVQELERSPVPGSDSSGQGWMRESDLANYAVQRRAPLRGWFRGFEILSMPPPSSGGVALLEALAVLEGLPLDHEMRQAEALARARHEQSGVQPLDHPMLSDRMLHWWIEALRGAFADRAQHLGDPAFHAVPIEQLLDPKWSASRRMAIHEKADPGLQPLALPREGGQTTHLSVLDREGNAVSLTTTLNTRFGSGILVRDGGYLLNNELDDFAISSGSPNTYGLIGGTANAIQPGKRPLSSMTPTIVRQGDGETVLVLGSPGGPRIISAVYAVLLRVLLLGQNLEEAVRAPRFHQQWSPVETVLEPGFDPLLVQGLRSRAHPLQASSGYMACVQAISFQPGSSRPVAVSDPRRGGSAGLEGELPSKPTRPETSLARQSTPP